MDCSLPGPSVHGILQARILEWSRLACPPPGDLSNTGMEPMSLMSPALVGKFFSTNIPWLDLEVSYFSYKILLHCYSNQNSVALAEGQIYRTTNRTENPEINPHLQS